MSKQSEVAVAKEAELSMLWPTVRKLDTTINVGMRQIAVSKSELLMGNGNEVVWEVGSLLGYTLEIELGPDVDPSSLSQGTGTTQVRGNLQLSRSAPMTGRVKVPYSVFLRKTADRSRIELQHVGSLPLGPALASLSGPYLVIDRMGDPTGDPDMDPSDPPRAGESSQ